MTFFDMNWNIPDFKCKYPKHPNAISLKSKNFDMMKKYAIKLSRPFIFVRLDFYEYNDEVRLAELTFTPMNGYYKREFQDNIRLGKFFQIVSKGKL